MFTRVSNGHRRVRYGSTKMGTGLKLNGQINAIHHNIPSGQPIHKSSNVDTIIHDLKKVSMEHKPIHKNQKKYIRF